MKQLTVKQLAAFSGVTVRTLHHYHEIGLLRPAFVGTNGYRYYGREELLRLQQILFHRELGVPLSAIADLLYLKGDDHIAMLRRHREKLEGERERYRVLIETIDRTIAVLNGEQLMSNADLYKGFSAEKQAGYEAWLTERYGKPMHLEIESAKRSYASLTSGEKQALRNELQEIEAALVCALRERLDPASDAVDALITRHRAWVAAMWGRPCSTDAYSGLANLYLTCPDFVARYERIEKGFAAYLARTMKLHVKRQDASRGGPPNDIPQRAD